jgi:tungstate transport system substrate-binding protein
LYLPQRVARRSNGEEIAAIEVDPALFNPYGSVLVNPAKWPTANFGDAKIWHQWVPTKPGLDAILSYRINGGELFFPPRASPSTASRC